MLKVVVSCLSVSSGQARLFLYLGSGSRLQGNIFQMTFQYFIYMKLCFSGHLISLYYNLYLSVITIYLYIFLFIFPQNSIFLEYICMPECRSTKKPEKGIRFPWNCGMSQHVWVLETEPSSSARALCALNNCVFL